MKEVIARKQQNDLKKERLGDDYIDNDYLSCTENGLPHASASFNHRRVQFPDACIVTNLP